MRRGYIRKKDGTVRLVDRDWNHAKMPTRIALDWDSEVLGEYGATKGAEGDRMLDQYIADRVCPVWQRMISGVYCGRTKDLTPVIVLEVEGPVIL